MNKAVVNFEEVTTAIMGLSSDHELLISCWFL